MNKGKIYFWYFAVALCIALAITFFTAPNPFYTEFESEAAKAPLAVHFIDVGQGDSAYIKLPNGEHMLIDAGEYEDGPVVSDYLESCGVDRLDYVVATHPHEDHIGGMTYVIEHIGTDIIYMPDASSNTSTFERMLDAIEDNNIKVGLAEKGVKILDEEDLDIEILSPVSGYYEETNDYSAVVRIEYGDTAFMFMGDAEKYVERQLLSEKEDLQADVIKLGHHGSSTSSSEDFIRAVDPELAVISCGADNPYGHPHRETVRLMEKLKTEYLRTDYQGTIVTGSNGESIIY